MRGILVSPGKLEGQLKVPGSKSVAHRAIICSALARNVYSGSAEILSDRIETGSASSDILVTRKGIRDILSSQREINCGESGSTLRFLLPVAAALGKNVVFTGEGRLPKRPLDEYSRIFPEKNVQISFPEKNSEYLPCEIKGKLNPGEYTVRGDVSSQYITGLMLALPLLGKGSVISVEGQFESKAYVDITAEIMETFGINVIRKGNEFVIPEGQKYSDIEFDVEGDYSQAAFWLTANYLGSDVTLTGLSDDSKQGDRKMIEILRNYKDMSLSRTNCGCYAKCPVIRIDVSQIPDLVPAVAVAALATDAVTEITNASRLRYKESDRIKSTVSMIKSIGGDASEVDDSIMIRGSAKPWPGGIVDPFGDHRIVMAAAIAGLYSRNGVRIKDHGCVSKSYPAFFEDFRKLKGAADEFDNG